MSDIADGGIWVSEISLQACLLFAADIQNSCNFNCITKIHGTLILNVLQMISYVPTSLAWPSPSPKKTQDPKTLTYKVKHFLPPYQKKWKKGKQKAEEPLSGKDRLMALLLAEKAATTVALKASSSFRPTTAAYDLETSSTETETSQKNGLFQVCRYLKSKTCFIWQSFTLFEKSNFCPKIQF